MPTIASIYACSLLLFCEAAQGWSAWFSPHPAHRQQTDAMLQGRLALDSSPRSLRHDLAWAEGGVQQVWGLGVPLWRLPFEILARFARLPGFPDRLALAAFIALAAWATLGRVLCVRGAGPSSFARGTGSVLLLLFFPATISLLRCRMSVYEEVLVYVFFFGLLLAMALHWLACAPDGRKLAWLGALAGMGGLVRPTLSLYGIAALLVGTAVLFAGSAGPQGGRSGLPGRLAGKRLRPCSWRLVWPGFLAFAAGGAVLWFTNTVRFGEGFEFGHRLNVQHESLMGSVYATRFGHPYEHELFGSAARELIGATFGADRFNGGDWYAQRIFNGQSPTLRWREMYFTTFDGWVGLVAGLGWCVAALSRVRLGKGPRQPVHEAVGPKSLRPDRALAAWSAASCALLFIFYLRTPVLSSRYVMDFAPGLAVAVWVSWGYLVDWACSLRRSRMATLSLSLAALAAWCLNANRSASANYVRLAPMCWAEVKAQLDAAAKGVAVTHLPEAYTAGLDPQHYGIPYNGVGWDWRTAIVQPAAILFVEDPGFVELEVLADRDLVGASSPEWIAARIGLEPLATESIQAAGKAWIIRFARPIGARYQRGIQPLFLAFVAPAHLADQVSPWRLQSVRWRGERSSGTSRPAEGRAGT